MLLLAPALTCTLGMLQLLDCFNSSKAAGALESLGLPKSLELLAHVFDCRTKVLSCAEHPVSKKVKTLLIRNIFNSTFWQMLRGENRPPQPGIVMLLICSLSGSRVIPLGDE